MEIWEGRGVFGLGNLGGRGGHSDPGNLGGWGVKKPCHLSGRGVSFFSGINHSKRDCYL